MSTHDEFTTAYLTAALWASTDDTNPERGGEPLDDNYGIEDIESDTLAEMVADCARFQAEHADLIDDGNLTIQSQHNSDSLAGHDFWLTRNGHGAGFWDGDWREPAGSKLDAAAKAFGEYDITASGNGGQVSKM